MLFGFDVFAYNILALVFESLFGLENSPDDWQLNNEEFHFSPRIIAGISGINVKFIWVF